MAATAEVVCKDSVSWMPRPEAPLPSGFERTRHEMLRRLEAPAP